MHHGYRLNRSVIGALALILALPTLSHATVATFAGEPNGEQCEIADPGPGGVVTVYVLMKYSLGAAGFHFSAPLPPGSGLTHVADNSQFVLVGNSQSDLWAGFGTCESGTIVVMSMVFVRTSAGDPCTLYQAQPGASYTDCSFAEFPVTFSGGVALNSNGHCSPTPFKNLSPLDGATNVPLMTALSWKSPVYLCNAPLASAVASADASTVFFGTSANPPAVAYDEQSPYAVGPLLPSTTYYWRIHTDYPYDSSPVWSFTTTNTVATQPSTWGAIKALYR